MIKLDDKIKRMAAYYIHKFGTNNPAEIIQALNIMLFSLPLGQAAGMYKYIKKTRCIFINSDIEDEPFMRVVQAHELGHALLHPKENCCFMAHHTLLLPAKIETQANLFAAELLITDEMIEDFSGFTLEQFINCTGMPHELIKIKLNAVCGRERFNN